MSNSTYPYPFDSNNLLGQFIRQRRHDLNMTQVELASLTGIGQGNISDLERGRISLPSVTLRRRLADALQVNHVDLLVAAGELDDAEIRQSGTNVSLPPAGSVRREWLTFGGSVTDEMLSTLLIICRGVVEQTRRQGIETNQLSEVLSSPTGD